jgi:pyruvate dehydrogenase E1 component alpha subunit
MEKELTSVIHGWHALEGEEGTVVGTFFNLRPDDSISAHFRGPLIAYYIRGGSLRKLIAGMMGKETGYTRGRIHSKSGPICLNAMGKFSNCLGTNFTLVLGAALAAKLQKTDRVAVMTFGDGTSNRGDFHETLNFAAVLDLPMVFVCQNNGFGSTLRFTEEMRCGSVADRAGGYGIPGVEVDGNDVLAVHQAVQEAVKRAREGRGPSLIDSRSYRLSPHNVADDQYYRTREEVEEWRKKDPVDRFQKTLLGQGILTEGKIQEIRRGVETEVLQAIKQAQEDPFPGAEALGIGDAFAPEKREGGLA